MILRDMCSSLGGINHPEDLIIKHGSTGAYKVMNDLSNLANDTSTMSIKWDGFPAVVFGRDATGTLVFIDKHMYDKVVKGTIDFTTIREYDISRNADRSDLWEKEDILRPILEEIVPKTLDNFYMGDLMWSGVPVVDQGYFTLKPNTVEYRIKVNSTLGSTISDSAGGIAVHTHIPGLGASDQPLIGLKGLPHNKGITFLVGEMATKPTVIIDENILNHTTSVINKHSNDVDQFINDLTAIKAKMVLTAMGPFITSMLDENDIASNIVPRFLEFVKGRISNTAAQKLLGTNNDGWLYQQDGGASGLIGLWTMWSSITNLKIQIKNQIDDHLHDSEVQASINDKLGHEGYVFGAGSSKLKLIDRLGFSRANFAKHKVSDNEIAAKSQMPMASFCFGRMNPPTLGHNQLMQKTIEVGNTNSFIFLSNSHNSKSDPLDPQTKSAFISKIYPTLSNHLVTDYVPGPIYAANWLYDQGFRHMTFVAGSDRLGNNSGSIEKLLNSWNSGPIRCTDSSRGPTGREYVVLKFVSSGERTIETNNMVASISGTRTRNYAAEGDTHSFNYATGVGSYITVNGKTLYQATREGMGITLQLDNEVLSIDMLCEA
jgi:hypothetical protein